MDVANKRYNSPFLTTALQYQELPYEERKIIIEYDDFALFDRHFYRITTQRGWFPHKHNGDLQVVLPLTELDHLDPITDDPTGWVMRNHDSPGQPVLPHTMLAKPEQTLVNVSSIRRTLTEASIYS